ncbi:hypothetical protein ARSEF4850_000060 [Beauveria asiatica]
MQIVGQDGVRAKRLASELVCRKEQETMAKAHHGWEFAINPGPEADS